jgi:CheY-like chemotaxis protein
VEDDPDIRAVLCELLADAGYTPTMEATDGRKALTVLRRSLQPLVVLLDLGLPRLGGAELLRRMAGVDRWRQRPRRPQQHAFVLVTAGYETARPQLASLVDAWQIPVVRKPFDLDELLAVVAQAASRLRPAIQRRGRNGD